MTIAYIRQKNMLRYLFANSICLEMRTVFWKRKNCELRGTYNVLGQISEHFFVPNENWAILLGYSPGFVGTYSITWRVYTITHKQKYLMERLAGTLTRDWLSTNEPRQWCQQSHCCASSTDKPQHWLRLCPMRNLQYELFSTTECGKLVH